MAFGIDDAALATILAGLASTAGSIYTNRKNIDAQAAANQINWDIARQNNATQIEMANTAHQREVRDLRAAGLNPILSAGGNGSSTPVLTSPHMQATHIDNAFEGLANSARGIGRYLSQEYKANVENTQAATAEKAATAEAMAADVKATKLDNEIKKARMPAIKAQAEIDAALGSRNVAALNRVLGGVNYLDGGRNGRIGFPDKDWLEADKLLQDGWRSQLKNKANANWRANLETVSQGVNSAAGVLRAVKRGGK